MNLSHFHIATLLFGTLACTAADTAIVDRYGQYTREEWPGKITSDGQLRADASREWEKLSSLAPDSARFDRYGGRRDGKVYRATGFFRLEKIDGRW